MPGKIDLNPRRLSVLASRSADGAALARVPVYAEVGWYSSEPAPPPETRLARAQFSAIRNADPVCESTDGCPAKFDETMAEALAIVLPAAIRNQLARDLAAATDLLTEAVKLALEIGGVESLSGISAVDYRRTITAALRAAAQLRDLETIPVAAKEPATYPLGLLATDHVGYLSFDLERLPEPVRASLRETMSALRDHPTEEPEQPARLWLYPLGLEALRADALAQRCFADDLLLARLELPLAAMPPEIANLGILSLQNPGLADWRVSPGSFAHNPGALLGADGCETILPANLATHEFYFHQVIGVPPSEAGLPIDPAAADKVRAGFVNEYRVRLIPIGHSLGQILYTFGLAPGESVNFAVIDWTRRDTALRSETTKLNESLVHELRRDRVISETVRASIEEWQRGNSSMSGLGASLGGAVGGSGLGAALGISGALGATSSTSRGSRDIAADTVQRLSDNIAQASAASREINSTVVVQSAQAEHEAIETRTIVNYNHSHALTVLYYEVLRHYRLVTEFVGRRPALLTNIHGGIAFEVKDPAGVHHEIYWPNIYENRTILQAALLDDRFKDGFDLVDRFFHRQRVAKIAPPPIPAPAPSGPPPPQGPHFRYFLFEMKTGGLFLEHDNNEDVDIVVRVDLNVAPHELMLANGARLNPHGSFFLENSNNWFAARMESPGPFTIPWGEIVGFRIIVNLHGGDNVAASDLSLSYIKVTGIDEGGGDTLLFERDYHASGGHLVFDSAWTLVLPARRPPPPPLPPPPAGRPQAEIEEEARFQGFAEHLLNRRPHYERALRLNAPPAQRAFELANLGVGPGSSLLEKVDNRPLEVLGDFVAYPCTDPDWSDRIMAAIDRLRLPDVAPAERLITFPTRGVFAEAKLGHCNASEEIDNTRFWDWQQSPIPHLAPEIAPLQPVTPGAVPPAGLQPSPFPSSLLHIVNPPAAPDPTGMSAALTALATANIFRDMSGRAELADVLKKLSDNSVAIAGTAQKAATGGIGGGAGGGGGNPIGGTGSAAARATPVQPAAANRDLHDLQGVLSRAQSQGLITPEAAQGAYRAALDNALGAGALDLQQVGDTEYTRSATAIRQLVGLVGERVAAAVLRAEGMTVFVDWRKHVAGPGPDMLALKPGPQSELWLIDNKAQMRGISGADALTADYFTINKPQLRDFLEKTWLSKAEGAAAIEALDNNRVKLVVANAWAGENVRFTKALFDKGLHAYDVRLRGLFADHAGWAKAFGALPRGIGLRRIGGSRGFATVGASMVVTIAAGGAFLLLTSGDDVLRVAYETTAQIGVELLLSRLPGGLFAGLVLGLKSDNEAVLAKEGQIDEICKIIPNFEALSPADQKSSRDAIKELIENPLEEDPTVWTLPEFNFDFRPSMKL